jgi:RND family efflux transporter MFP subunit
MKTLTGFTLPFLIAALVGCDPATLTQGPQDQKRPDPEPAEPMKVQQVPKTHDPPAAPAGFEVVGRTQSAPGRKALIAPVPLHPVVEVLVKPGDRVTKGQPLVKLDDDEAQADVRVKKANLENATIVLKEARRYLVPLLELYRNGNLPEQKVWETRVALAKAEQAERAARAELEGSEAELEHYTVTAYIDGVISWLDVYPGMVSRPGTTVWGEILDLSKLDVRCEVTPEQADRIRLGQEAEVLPEGRKGPSGMARVVYIGVAADQATGLIPVMLRLDNTKANLRSNVPVRVKFKDT